MAEYIEREDALELLEQPITMSTCLTVDECASKRNQRLIDCALIKSIPAADVVPVVRCKDCRHCSKDTVFGALWCDGRKVSSEWFCAGGDKE